MHLMELVFLLITRQAACGNTQRQLRLKSEERITAKTAHKPKSIKPQKSRAISTLNSTLGSENLHLTTLSLLLQTSRVAIIESNRLFKHLPRYLKKHRDYASTPHKLASHQV
jgi:hypothetical protein